jgi:hypothetical protein
MIKVLVHFRSKELVDSPHTIHRFHASPGATVKHLLRGLKTTFYVAADVAHIATLIKKKIKFSSYTV